jgi:hypothetical protein
MASQPPTESDPKGGEKETPESKVTRQNFESLAKGLFGVSREAYAAAERKFEADKVSDNVAKAGPEKARSPKPPRA